MGHIKTRIGRHHYKQHADETVGGKSNGHTEEEQGQVLICGPNQEGGEGSGGQGASGRVPSMGGTANRGQRTQGGDREGRTAAAIIFPGTIKFPGLTNRSDLSKIWLSADVNSNNSPGFIVTSCSASLI